MQVDLRSKAILNYIAWWKAVCKTHQIQTQYHQGIWQASSDVPSYYPELISANEHIEFPPLAPHILTIVDSYAKFQIPGFTKLFEAQWMTSSSVVPYSGEWLWIRDPGHFPQWIIASGLEGIILPTILDDDHVVIFYKENYGGFSAYESEGVIGVYNIFGDEHLYQDIPAVLANFFPEHPVISYEAGEQLEKAKHVGWTTLGAMNIWTRIL